MTSNHEMTRRYTLVKLELAITFHETHGRSERHMNQEEVEKKSEAIHGKRRIGGQSHADFERG